MRVHRGLCVLLALPLGLAACETARPPEPGPPQAAPAPPPVPAAPRPSRAGWSFMEEDACTAVATGNGLTLTVAVTPDTVSYTAQAASGTAMPGAAVVPIAFSGPSGRWAFTGRRAGPRRVVASETMSAEQASRVLFLLKGGVLRIGRTAPDSPALELPDAGKPGQDWFDCVRKMLLP